MNTENLRQRLRIDTEAVHHQLDTLVSAFNLHTPDGYRRFLSFQIEGLDHLIHGLEDQDPGLRKEFDQQRAALAEDLAKLGTTVRRARRGSPLHPLAISYIFHGSRAGTRILRQRWQLSEDATVRGAGAYFAREADAGSWAALRQKLSEMSAHGDQSDRVVADAERIFTLYLEAAQRQEDDAQAASMISDGVGIVVEDNPIIALDTAELLKSHGAQQVYCASTVDEAVLIMKNGKITFAVLDVYLKGETSARLAHQLHADKVPFIVASGDQSDSRTMLSYPDAVLVEKPFNDASILSGLRKAHARAEALTTGSADCR
jgi:heme oxygenase/CheY-like chemotaxis protein